MSENGNRPFLLSLLVTFVRSFVFTAARVLIMGWYVYFGLEFGKNLQQGAMLYLAMFPLSIYGLWMLTGLPNRLMKPADRSSEDEDTERPIER